ncbi:MAG: porin [Tolumonas sp.]|nr:porin [Tolumonas sp.]
MKKTLLAVVTSSLFAASANAAVVFDKDGQQVDVYGRVEYDAGQINYQTANTAKAENFGGDGTARLGVNGKWATGYDASLIGKLEWDASAEAAEGSKFDNRYAWAGADFGNGVQVTAGHLANPYAQLADLTDLFNLYGDVVAYGDIASRLDDAFNVSYAADGWDMRAAYSFADANKVGTKPTATTSVSKDAFAFSEGYTFSDIGLKVVGAYQQADFDTTTSSSVVNKNTQYSLGFGYTYDAFYLGADYGRVQNESDVATAKDNVLEVAATYKVDALTFLAGFNQRDPLAGTDTVKEYVLGTQYDITAKAKAYAEYRIQDVANADDTYGVGIQYNF